MYGIIQKLLNDEYDVHETVMIESLFHERTRKGKYCGTVILAITPANLIIASQRKDKSESKSIIKDLNVRRKIQLESLYPLSAINLTIFKKTLKQTIKMAFTNVTRYFELGSMDKRKVFWRLWCLHISEIRKGSSLWPYLNYTISNGQTTSTDHEDRVRWNDKYLYLGTHRDAEDQIRPTPVPGLGRSDEIKLLYLKPQYFGCWDQAEHWVQCDEVEIANVEYHNRDVFTHAGCQLLMSPALP